MKKNSWSSYWKSTDRSFIERWIQAYKAKRGYGKLLQAIPEIGSSGRVLEVGAGKAWLSQLLRKRGWHTTAIDLDPGVVEQNKAKVDQYVLGDMYHLPFEKGAFDLVMSCGLLEHFNREEIQGILSEMKRVGKTVVAWLPTCGVEWRMLWAFRNWLGAEVYDKAYPYSLQDIQKLFMVSGLKNIRVGVVPFAAMFHYIYLYGVSDTVLVESTEEEVI